MSTLNTTYAGIELKNPLIVGASNLVTSEEMLKKLEDAGAAAIIYKSLFEEQIQLESYELSEAMTEYYDRHAEMTSLFPDLEHAGPQEYLLKLQKAVKSVNIPVFASLNAVADDTWVEWSRQLEATGVAGIELNFYAVPRAFDVTAASIEAKQLSILKAVKAAVKIPVTVKLSPFYSNPLHLIAAMDKAGADGFVLFNSLFQPDIDIEEEKHHFPYNLSTENDNRLSLRFAGLLYGNVKASVCSNTGIIQGADLIKMLLAGADSVQVVSALYKYGPKQITQMLKDLDDWMEGRKYTKLSDFRGKLSRKNIKDPFIYKRAQYVDILMQSDNIFKKYPLL